jgi:hypothetical protein
MADTEAKKRVQKAIQDNVMPMAKVGFSGIAKAVPELAKAMKTASDAIKKGESADLLETYRRDLKIKLRDVSDARGSCLDALDALAEATKEDADFEADLEEVKALKAKLVKAGDLLADQIIKGKKIEDAAKAAAAQNLKDETTAHREWDATMTLFERQTARAAAVLKTLRNTRQGAEAAVKARDAEALKKCKDELAGFQLNDVVLQGKLLLQRTNEVLSKYDLDSFSKEFVDEMAKDKATTIGEYDENAKTLMVEMKAIKDAVAKLEIDAPDAVKATAKLGFKASFVSKVAAALKLDESKIPKALEDIAKQAGVEATGKELFDKLKKEKLYP